MESFISMFTLGLLLLILAWLIQLVYTKEGKKEIRYSFVVVYAFGVMVIVLDGLMQGLILSPILNLMVLIVILAILVDHTKKKKRKD